MSKSAPDMSQLITQDIHLFFTKKLTLIDLANFAKTCQHHSKMYDKFLKDILFKFPQLLLSELSYLSVKQLSSFLYHYQPQIDDLCEKVFKSPKSENDVHAAYALKVLVMDFSIENQTWVTIENIQQSLAFLEKNNISGHIKKSITFQKQLLDDDQHTITLGQNIMTLDGNTVFISSLSWLSKKKSIVTAMSNNNDFFKNLCGIRFTYQTKSLSIHDILLEGGFLQTADSITNFVTLCLHFNDHSMHHLLCDEETIPHLMFKHIQNKSYPTLNYFPQQLDLKTVGSKLEYFQKLAQVNRVDKIEDIHHRFQVLYHLKHGITCDRKNIPTILKALFNELKIHILEDLFKKTDTLSDNHKYDDAIELLVFAYNHAFFQSETRLKTTVKKSLLSIFNIKKPSKDQPKPSGKQETIYQQMILATIEKYQRAMFLREHDPTNRIYKT